MADLSRKLVWLGIVLILASGFVHLIDARDSFEDAVYKGWLFYANALGTLVAACGIYGGRRWGWGLGLFIAAASLVLYTASRTVGLPYIPAEPENWLEPLGVVSLISEGSFVAVYMRMRKAQRRQG